MLNPPFIVFTLPRSRSAWLSHFLSTDNLRCGHDIALDCQSVEQFIDRLDAIGGTVETGSVLGAKALRILRPDIKMAVVQRPVGEVLQSLASIGLFPAPAEIEHRAALLDDLAQEPGVLVLTPEDLNHYGPCAELFDFCRGLECSRERWDWFCDFNVQLNIPRRLAKLQATSQAVQHMKAQLAEGNYAGTC